MKKRLLSSLMAVAMSVSVGVAAGIVTVANTDATPAYAETAMSVELTGDHYQGNSHETPYSFRLGDSAHFSATVSGAEGDVTYTYRMIPRTATPDFGTKEYSSSNGKLTWKPERGGIFCVEVTATDSKGNKAYKSLYYHVVTYDLSIDSFRVYGNKTSSKIGEEVKIYLNNLNAIGYPTYFFKIFDMSGVQAPLDITQIADKDTYNANILKWTPQCPGTYLITGTVMDNSNQSATANMIYTVTE